MNELINRRKSKDRRRNSDRRKSPRRMGEIFPPLGTDDWKKIVKTKIKEFIKSHMITIQEFKDLVDEIENE